MTIAPSGSPPWLRTNSLEHYGGDLNKQNYLSRGAIDALTDVDAAQFCRLASDVASLQRVMPFCTLTYTCNDSSPAPPTVSFVHMQTGISGSYAGDTPGSGFPALSRNGNGDVSITFSSSYQDSFGVSGAFSVSSAIPSLLSATAGEVVAQLVSSTVVRVRAFSTSGTAISDAVVTISIW